jgi:hypothetical protein
LLDDFNSDALLPSIEVLLQDDAPYQSSLALEAQEKSPHLINGSILHRHRGDYHLGTQVPPKKQKDEKQPLL